MSARPIVLRRIDLRRALLHDFPLKAAALVLALVLWVLVVQASVEREVTSLFDGRVPVERPDIPAGMVLRSSLGDVGVRLRGPENTVLPRVTVNDLRATVDLAGVDLAVTRTGTS